MIYRFSNHLFDSVLERAPREKRQTEIYDALGEDPRAARL